MRQVEFNTKGTNPFFGMKTSLTIYQNASKGQAIGSDELTKAWAEASTVEQKAMLFSLLFYIGDVVGRQHNAFETKVDSGGSSQRVVFRDNIIPFLVAKVSGLPKASRLRLIELIVEYTTLDNVVATRVKTKKGTNKVESVLDMIKVFGNHDVATYVANIIRRGTVFQKICVAKFVTRPRFSKRVGKKQMLSETKAVMAAKAELLIAVSNLAKLPMEDKGSYINFLGFYAWRKEFNYNLESVLFSSKTILELDQEQFIQLVDKMPSDARFRVRNRVMFNEKWATLKPWYQAWETFKEGKQAEQRQIETAIENGNEAPELKAKLAKVKQEAKVNTGAIEFASMFEQIVLGKVDKIKVQPFLDKINLPYNNLVFVDDSGSMASNRGNGFSARDFGAFIATIMLTKNPDADARDLIGLFSSSCRMYNGISGYNSSPNSLLTANVVKTAKKSLINSEDHFLDNLKRLRSWLDAESTWDGTNLTSITRNIGKWAQGDSNRLEQLQKYPIWTLISDGNFNNNRSAEGSLNEFFAECQKYLGFKPFLILIDVAGKTSAPITRFAGIENVMMVPPNPAAIEMLLTNFRDMDTYDIYTPLQSLYRTNRYAPIRQFVEEKLVKKNVKESLTID